MTDVSTFDRLEVRRREVDPADYKRTSMAYNYTVAKEGRPTVAFRNATLDDVSTLVTRDTLVFDAETGRVMIAYMRIPEDASDLVRELHTIPFAAGYRSDGSPVGHSAVAGLKVRNMSRKLEYCSTAALARHAPAAHAAILDYAIVASQHYAELNPELYESHLGMARTLEHPEWRIGDSPFTSGIVNKDNVLPYHYDRGNVEGGWSLMLGFKRDVQGGHLVIPEYDLALEVADNTLSGFDGQIALHGVSPFRKLSRYAYRYTIVYYAKAGAWQCLSPAEELQNGKRVRTLKEVRRAGLELRT